MMDGGERWNSVRMFLLGLRKMKTTGLKGKVGANARIRVLVFASPDRAAVGAFFVIASA